MIIPSSSRGVLRVISKTWLVGPAPLEKALRFPLLLSMWPTLVRVDYVFTG